MFFVLSGFLITHLIMTEIGRTGQFSLRAFYIRRIRRLMPAYALALVFCIFAAFLVPGWGTLRGALASMFYVSNWSLILAPDKGLGMLHHTWTLSLEEQFYLVWPALLLAISLRPQRALHLGTLAACIVIALLTLAIAVTLSVSTPLENENLLATLAGFLMLICGSLLALLRHRLAMADVNRASKTGIAYELGALAALAALAAVSALYPDHLPRPVAWLTIIASSSVLILASVHSSGLLHWCFTRPALVGIGIISYGLYLWHFPIFYLVDVYLGLDDRWAVALAAALSLCVSIASYQFVETPFRRGSIRKPPSQAPAAGTPAQIPSVD